MKCPQGYKAKKSYLKIAKYQSQFENLCKHWNISKEVILWFIIFLRPQIHRELYLFSLTSIEDVYYTAKKIKYSLRRKKSLENETVLHLHITSTQCQVKRTAKKIEYNLKESLKNDDYSRTTYRRPKKVGYKKVVPTLKTMPKSPTLPKFHEFDIKLQDFSIEIRQILYWLNHRGSF